jgi:2-polyprenyl-3-methyl-5-hydroxy-6-metoxy-1,4-benzoquinol methylase
MKEEAIRPTQLIKCDVCNTLFINPRPSRSLLFDFYENGESIKYWNDHIFPVSEEKRREQIFLPRALKVKEILERLNIEVDTLVDIGAGYGTFCEEIKKLNVFKKVIAVEPSKDLADSCIKKGIETIVKPIENVNFEEEISLITNFELIEHLYSPKDFLMSCASKLKKNGMLVLTTPNIKGFDLLVLGKLANGICGPNHLNYFHPNSIKILLERCGFKVLEILTPGRLDVELVRKKYLKKELSLENNAFLRYIFDEKWDISGKFQNFLAENNLSSHMWVVAQKAN